MGHLVFEPLCRVPGGPWPGLRSLDPVPPEMLPPAGEAAREPTAWVGHLAPRCAICWQKPIVQPSAPSAPATRASALGPGAPPNPDTWTSARALWWQCPRLVKGKDDGCSSCGGVLGASMRALSGCCLGDSPHGQDAVLPSPTGPGDAPPVCEPPSPRPCSGPCLWDPGSVCQHRPCPLLSTPSRAGRPRR